MVSAAARAGGALGAIAAFVVALARGGLTAWAAAALTAGSLLLVVAVLFVPSETPARRLRGLIQAWQGSAPSNPQPATSQPPVAASPAADDAATRL